MRKFNVTVNGTNYEVSVDEIKDEQDVVSTPSAPVQAAPAKTAAPTPAPVASSASGEKVTAPMPGTVLDIKVSVGQAVKKGDVLVVLEAMKMENEIKALNDGEIGAVLVSKSAVVETGETLVVYK